MSMLRGQDMQEKDVTAIRQKIVALEGLNKQGLLKSGTRYSQASLAASCVKN